MLKELFLELIVSDVKKSVEYYHKYFGFVVDMFAPNEENPSWCQISNNGIKIMMQDFEETKKEMKEFPDKLSSSNLILLKYDNYDKFKEIYDLLNNNKIDLFMNIRETEYGTFEFGVFDPDKNMIVVSVEK